MPVCRRGRQESFRKRPRLQAAHPSCPLCLHLIAGLQDERWSG
jgi:hypothetical protein